ncbi:PREDICTED: E3 ubiquitin-protein ligase TRIM39-like [Nanorana parkeri]|uniref:E3 ubiquitin-protein ligase TRIM39-like n=1 Tax=Nanorana parkeri TaxID=125878 RepID=UPI0008548CAF|nr:PREDICTED: E3 ubiquitin-protein ligase TRIM39-like [Nanorana parkeri]
MASANLKAELECSICLSIYTDPVMLKCGHNFCQVCIDCVLNTQGGSRGYSCPECRDEFQERPALQRNMKLRNIVDNFLSTQSDQEESEVFCCIHRKLLEYYCIEDDTCVCVSCCLIGEHAGHKMESVKEASGKKKNKMRKVLQKLLTKGGKTEERIQSLQKHRRKIEEKSASGKEKVTALFRDLRRQLKVLEGKVLSEISGQANRVSFSIMNVIQELERKKEELSKKMHHIEELFNMMDPLTVLQESDTGDLCDAEDGDNEERQRHGKLFHDEGDLDMAVISQILQTGLSDIMSGVNVQKHTGAYVYPHFSTEDNSSNIAVLVQEVPQPASTIQDTHHQPGRPSNWSALKMSGLPQDTDITLDVNTAGNDLCISYNRKTVSYSVFTHKYPERPERFQSAQVLSTQSFSSGQHYWEVDVERSQVWSIGMCYPSINRKGCHSEIGWNNKSWGLHKSWLNNQYSVLYDRNWIRLPGKLFSKRVRIYLDYEAGQISFYDMCTLIRHLYTFNVTFTEPLHAVLWVGGGNIKICRDNQDM